MSEFKYQWTLIGVSMLIYAGLGFFLEGIEAAVGIALSLPFVAFYAAVFGVVACLITAQLFGTDFGTMKSAIINFAAVALFPGAVALLLLLISPIFGLLAFVILSFTLLQSLFELETFDLIAFVIILFSISSFAQWAIVSVFASIA